jgi:hypothetical protein
MCATCPAYLPLLNLVTLIFNKQSQSWNSFFQPTVTASLYTQIFTFSNTSFIHWQHNGIHCVLQSFYYKTELTMSAAAQMEKNEVTGK